VFSTRYTCRIAADVSAHEATVAAQRRTLDWKPLPMGLELTSLYWLVRDDVFSFSTLCTTGGAAALAARPGAAAALAGAAPPAHAALPPLPPLLCAAARGCGCGAAATWLRRARPADSAA